MFVVQDVVEGAAAPDGYDASLEPRFQLKIVPFDRPLDDQIGVAAKECVPADLMDLVFGDSAAGPSDAAALPSLQTYALLDAAKVDNLAAVITTSELEHRCLFKGKLGDALGDVAPWLVRLEPDARLTRHLFTSGEMPAALWDKSPGVFLRSRASFDALWSYLRKFTKVQDETGKWFYFRFWEPDFLETTHIMLNELASGFQKAPDYPVTLLSFRPEPI